MRQIKLPKTRRDERGAALLEWSITGAVFLTAVFGVLEFGRMLWTHNQLKDATRRGARYAAVRRNDAASIDAVKKMVVFGNPNPAVGARAVVPGLTTAMVNVSHKNWDGIRLSARADVSISNYRFNFAVPLIGTSVPMTGYRTAQPGESAGFVPCNIPTSTPAASCGIVPN